MRPFAATPAHTARILAQLRAQPPASRISLIDKTLESIPSSPTTARVFFRKKLLRLRDESRLEAGLVSATALHQENSPFALVDFKKARVSFRPRVRA